MMPTMSEAIRWSLVNFGASMLLLSLFIVPFDLLINYFIKKNHPYEILFRWVSFFAVGFTGIYTFVMHGFFPEYAARVIGWQNCPFQFEVAIADLAFGILGIFAFWRSYGFRLATTIGVTIWLWGDAFGHIYQMIVNKNFSTGNAGTWFLYDLIIPVILMICIIKMRKFIK